MIYVTSGGGSGGTLVVTAPAGVTVTATKDGKTRTCTAGSNGKATFRGLKTGTWSVTISNGSQTSAAQSVNIVADYAVTMAFFSASIAVTYPSGSTCTCTKGSTTLTASSTGGSYTFTVPSSGTWTVSCTGGGKTASKTVSITTNGQSTSVTLAYETVVYEQGMTVTSTTTSTPFKFRDLSNGQTVRSQAAADITINANGMLVPNGSAYTCFKNAYSMSGKSKIYFELAQNAESYSGTLRIDIYLSTSQYGDYNSKIAFKRVENGSTGKHFELDVSSLTGNVYLAFLTSGQNVSPQTIVTKLAIV